VVVYVVAGFETMCVAPKSLLGSIRLGIAATVLFYTLQNCPGAVIASAADSPSTTAERNLIVGGTEATPYNYPFIASLSTAGKHRCGATLIAPDVILTAAHCVIVEGSTATGSDSSGGEVQLGRHNLSDTSETYESFVWQRVESHPRYYAHSDVAGSDADPYDVALLKIYGVSQQAVVVPINRESEVPMTDERLLVMGWGTTDKENFRISSDVLRETRLGYIPNDVCIKAQGTSSGYMINYEREIIDVSLCAADFTNGSDICAGDSGSPLLSNDNNIQVGIVSASYGCSHPTLPSLNVRLSYVHEWIDDIVCELSNDPPEDFNCSISPTADVPPIDMEDTVQLSIQLKVDENPKERGWILQSIDANGREVTHAGRPILSFRDQEPISTVEEIVSVPNNREYTFTLLDSYGDGYCCDSNQGSLTISAADQSIDYVPETSDDFSFAKAYAFVVGTSPRLSPTESPSPTSSAQTTSSPTVSPPFLTVVIQLDEYPTETGYLVEALFAEDDIRLVAAVYAGSFGQEMANKLVVEQVDLLASSDQPERYRFTMIDNEHDGLSPGYYQVWLGPEEEDTMLFEGGVFFLEDVHIFEVPALPSPSPTRSPSSNGSSLYIHAISSCTVCFLLGVMTVLCM
jgi:secreted trypsin-like serine protease